MRFVTARAATSAFVTRPPEVIQDRKKLRLAPATDAVNGLYRLRKAQGSAEGTVVLQGSGVAMTFVNEVIKRPGELCRGQASRFLLALAPFAPHIAEELWERMGNGESIARAGWPEVDETYLAEETFELVVQVMGKVRGKTEAPRSASREELEELARKAAEKQLAGKQIVKTIVVPGRLVNFVVR